MWQGVEDCGRVWRTVAEVMAGCGGMWPGWGYVVGGKAYGMDRNMWWVWGHVAGVVAACGGMWQGVGHVAGVDVCGRGSTYSIDGDM